jgi:hypothetical protein
MPTSGRRNFEVSPGRLSPRRGGYLSRKTEGRELDHLPQRLVVDLAPVALGHLSGRRGGNLPAPLGAPALKYVCVNVMAELRVERCNRHVRHGGDLRLGRLGLRERAQWSPHGWGSFFEADFFPREVVTAWPHVRLRMRGRRASRKRSPTRGEQHLIVAPSCARSQTADETAVAPIGVAKGSVLLRSACR